jgi:LPXTG-site transpeptidase (sortase) family protein
MASRRPKTQKKSNKDLIGGEWLPNLLTWGGVLLMITGGIIAYPTLQNYLAPPDAQSLEFSVTPALLSTATAPPPVILPETELVTPESQGEAQAQLEAQATPEPTAEATPTPTTPATATPTPDPASLVPTRLVIPSINLDAPVIEVGWEMQEVSGEVVSSWVVPDSFAAGWHTTSAAPGQIGNTTFNGHHNIRGEVFRDLVELQPGDEIAVYAGDTVYYYSVIERHILEEKGQPMEVRLQNARWIMPTEDERLTLVTCWPYTNNTHRLIVVALPMQVMPTPTPMGQ